VISGAAISARAQISDLRRFLKQSDLKQRAIASILSRPELAGGKEELVVWAEEHSSFSSGRIYDSACATVMLYGLFERFIEDLAKEYLEGLCLRHTKFSVLPEKLKASYFEATIVQLQRTRDARYRGEHSASRLAASLNTCLSDQSPMDFLADSLLYHTANFRIGAVDDFFSRLGVQQVSRKAAQTATAQDYFASASIDVPSNAPEASWNLIDDLVERRNQVAHGDVSSVLALSEIGSYLEQVEAYCVSLSSTVRDAFGEVLVESHGVPHGRPLAVFNGAIVCIESKGAKITGNSLLVCRSANKWLSLGIREIQIKKRAVPETPAGEDVEVGLLTDGRCKASFEIYSLN
jgi:hypothetical protein